jgi:hypothetical protein
LIRRCFVAAVLNLLRDSNNSVAEGRGAAKTNVKAAGVKTAVTTVRNFGRREGLEP